MNDTKNKANIYIIAKEAGVSVATVSRFFNKKSLVKKSTGLKILDVCKKYNYKPSRVASAITTKKTKSIALLVPSLKDPAFGELVSGVEFALSKNEYCLNVFNTRESIDKEMEIIDIIDNRIIDGVIVSGVYGSKEDRVFTSEMLRRKIPCILVDRYIPGTDIPYVASNDRLGGEIAAKFLLENNHKRIGIISYDTKVHIFKERVEGFISILNKDELKEEFILEVPIKFGKIEEYIYKYKDELLKSRATAIFTVADTIAIFLIRFFLENGFKVPDEISVMGYDDIFYSKFIFPRLSTIHHDMFELGKVVGENLIYKLENGKFKKKKQVIDPTLVIRDSVRKV